MTEIDDSDRHRKKEQAKFGRYVLGVVVLTMVALVCFGLGLYGLVRALMR